MGCGSLEAYSRADVQRTIGIRLHDGRVTNFEVPSDSGAVVMYDIVLWYQGGFNWL